MSNYRIERIRKRFVVAAGLMVAAYSLQWAGILELSANAQNAVTGSTLSVYDLTVAEAVLINVTNLHSANWKLILAKSAMVFAPLFAAILLAAWHWLPRRAASACAALGMFAAFTLGLPFSPGGALIEASTGRPLAYYMGGEPDDWGVAQTLAPFGGGVPGLDFRAFAQEAQSSATAAKPGEADEFDFAATMADIERGLFWERVWKTAMGILIGVAFWSTFLGLVVVSLVRTKGRAAHG